MSKVPMVMKKLLMAQPCSLANALPASRRLAESLMLRMPCSVKFTSRTYLAIGFTPVRPGGSDRACQLRKAPDEAQLKSKTEVQTLLAQAWQAAKDKARESPIPVSPASWGAGHRHRP